MRFVLPFPRPNGVPLGRRSRHPLIRALSLLLGLVALGVLLVGGLIVAGVLLVGGTILFAVRQWHRKSAAAAAAPQTEHQPQTREGEFVVIQQGRPATH